MRSYSLILAVWLFSVGLEAATGSETLPVRYINAAEVSAALTDTMIDGGSIRAIAGALVVTGSERERASVRSLLEGLDRPPRNLMITLRAATEKQSAATVGINNQRNQWTEHQHHRISTAPAETEHSVRVLEGTSVLFSEGRLVAVAGTGWFGPGVDTVEFRRGLALRARIADETVILELRSEHYDTPTPQANRTVLDTTVSGRLGEWIPLSGTAGVSTREKTEESVRYRTRDPGESQLVIRVELAD